MADIAIEKNGPDTRTFHVTGQQDALVALENEFFREQPDIVTMSSGDTKPGLQITIRPTLSDADKRELWYAIFLRLATIADWDPGRDQVIAVR